MWSGRKNSSVPRMSGNKIASPKTPRALLSTESASALFPQCYPSAARAGLVSDCMPPDEPPASAAASASPPSPTPTTSKPPPKSILKKPSVPKELDAAPASSLSSSAASLPSSAGPTTRRQQPAAVSGRKAAPVSSPPDPHNPIVYEAAQAKAASYESQQRVAEVIDEEEALNAQLAALEARREEVRRRKAQEMGAHAVDVAKKTLAVSKAREHSQVRVAEVLVLFFFFFVFCGL